MSEKLVTLAQWHILAHEKPPQDDLVELGISPSGKEPEKYGLILVALTRQYTKWIDKIRKHWFVDWLLPVELDEKPEVDILRLGLSPPHLPVLVVPHVDRHRFWKGSISYTSTLN